MDKSTKSLVYAVHFVQVRYATRELARLEIVCLIEGTYNRVRLHSSIGYQAPVAGELGWLAA